MLFRIPSAWDSTLCVLLHLAELWSYRPRVFARANEIARAEGLGRLDAHDRAFGIRRHILHKLEEVGVLRVEGRVPRIYRLARTPSQIDLAKSLLTVSDHSTRRPLFWHCGNKHPHHKIRSVRFHKGPTSPSHYLFNRMSDVNVRFLQSVSVAEVFAANFGLKPEELCRVQRSSSARKARRLANLMYEVRPLLLEYCPLVERFNRSILGWPYNEIADKFREAFGAWYDELPSGGFRDSLFEFESGLKLLRHGIAQCIEPTPVRGSFGVFRKWERGLAMHACNTRKGFVAALERQPWDGQPTYLVLCADRDRLCRFASEMKVRKKTIESITLHGPGAPLSAETLGGFVVDACWGFFDRRHNLQQMLEQRAARESAK